MSVTNRVELDVSRLLGFRLQQAASQHGKVGTKPRGTGAGANGLLGAKVGGKEGQKLVAK